MMVKRKSQSIRPMVELLEGRVVPSVYWVKNTLDNGPNSLRQAVLDANAHPGADSIHFKPSAQGTIKLASELLLTGELTISGPGSNNLTVSGKQITRVFEIASGAKVVIEDLTIANGRVLGTAAGAGILNQGTLTLESSVVTGNVADAAGGAIANTGKLTLKRSRLSSNQAGTNGGGLHNGGTGVVVIDRSTIDNNLTVRDGAGIRSEIGTTLSIFNSSVSRNSASGFGTGGIAPAAKLTIRDSLIDNNTSAVGGLYLFGSSQGGDVLISHSIVRGNGPNSTSGSGVGGIWSRSEGNIKIEDSQISHNTGNLAGGIYGSGNIEINDSTIDQNTGRDAGGINVFGELTLNQATVKNNSGNRGGVSAQSATIVESTISGNAGLSVGGLYGYQLNLIRSTVSGNTATPTGEGFDAASGVGGVSITSGLIQNSTISGNVVLAGQMQAYPSEFSDTADATGGVFTQAGFGGTAVSIESSTIAFNRVKDAPADIRATGGVAVAIPVSFTYYGTTYDFSSSVGLRNTIIARNETGRDRADVGGDFLSAGHNLIGVLDAAATGIVASDLSGTIASPLNPRLGPLTDNGGPTKTHALERHSPAIDAGDNLDTASTDQRGKMRLSGGVVDIGAFESKSTGRSNHQEQTDPLRHLVVSIFKFLERFAWNSPGAVHTDSVAGINFRNDASVQSNDWQKKPTSAATYDHDHATPSSRTRDSLFGSSNSLRGELDRIDKLFAWLS